MSTTMMPATETLSAEDRLELSDFERLAPEARRALSAVSKAVADSGLDKGLIGQDPRLADQRLRLLRAVSPGACAQRRRSAAQSRPGGRVARRGHLCTTRDGGACLDRGAHTAVAGQCDGRGTIEAA